MTRSDGRGRAHDAYVTGGHDDRTFQEICDDEQRQAEDTVARLTTKRDKIAEQLADAEQALADAEAELEGDE